MSTLNLSIVQTSLQWEAPEANLSAIEALIARHLPQHTDLIVLPEMFNSGFTMNAPKVAERMDGQTVKWMKELAQSRQALVMGSLIIEESGSYYNRMVSCLPDGQIHTYDKRHLFRMADEHQHFSPGKSLSLFTYKEWTICPLICYDLRFPVWSRNRFDQQTYDLLVYVANWPERRSPQWRRLLAARAIENQCYVVGVNRVGLDGNQIQYRGDSVIHDYYGDELTYMVRGEGILTQVLDLEKLRTFRSHFSAYLDADRFSIHPNE
jgi:omega-amidase